MFEISWDIPDAGYEDNGRAYTYAKDAEWMGHTIENLLSTGRTGIRVEEVKP